MNKFKSKNERETFACGESFAQKLTGGEVLALVGDLGAGKTKFLQGLAKGLGVKHKVNSPTFNILKTYQAKKDSQIKTFCHIDAYRLSSDKDLIALGVEEYFQDKNTVTAIEWAEKVRGILPKKVIMIEIEYLDKENRIIKIKKVYN